MKYFPEFRKSLFLLSAVLPALLFCVPAAAQTNVATVAKDGAWTWYNDPRALFHNGILYAGHVRSSDGASALTAFDPETGKSTLLWTSNWLQKDDHDNCGLLPLQDGRLLAIYARHGSAPSFSYRLSLNANPVSPDDWGPEQTFANTTAGVTYSNPYQLSDESGRIYNFMRNLNFNPTFVYSDNNAATWSAPQLLVKTGTGSIRPYVKYSSDYQKRVDFLYTDGHPRDIKNSLYHMYYEAGALRKTDGTFLKNLADAPLLHDSGERGSVIYQYSETATNDPNDHIAFGRAWCWEVVSPATGPVCVFTVQNDLVTGSNWTDDRIYYYYARWTGTNWQKRFIAQGGRPLYNPEDDYAGGICIDPENPTIIYLSSNAANPFDLGSITDVPLAANQRYEIYKGVTTDGGLTFSWQPLTANSDQDNLRPYFPRFRNGRPALLWFRGTYSTFTAYTAEIVGAFTNKISPPPQVAIMSPSAPFVALSTNNVRLRLRAAATDDGLPGPLSYSWSTLSGPTNALFSSPATAETDATFPLPGSYVLQVTASDTALSANAETTVLAGMSGTLDAGMGMWLKLDETSGAVATDSSGHASQGAISGGYQWHPTGGQHGGALVFNGTDTQVVVNDSTNVEPGSAFTLSFWFVAPAFTVDSGGLISKRDNISSNNAFTTWLKRPDQRIYVDIEGSNDRFNSSGLINTGQWYHVGLVFDGSLPASQRARLYLNGVLDTVAPETSASIANYPSNLRVGNTHPGAANWFHGLIDDVRFYRRALSASEISQLAATNMAPVLAISPVGSVTSAIPVSLNGSAVDDGKGAPLTYGWSAGGGAGQVTFGSTNNTSTAATFSQAGDYTLRFSASDGTAEVAIETVVTVLPNTNVFADWIGLAYPGSTDPNVTGATADPDLDRVSNLAEFALGMNASLADAKPLDPGHAGLPIGRVQEFNSVPYLTLVVKRPPGRLGITYSAEVSSDLMNWTAAVLTGPATMNPDGTETMVFRDNTPAAGSARFIRLRLTQN